MKKYIFLLALLCSDVSVGQKDITQKYLVKTMRYCFNQIRDIMNPYSNQVFLQSSKNNFIYGVEKNTENRFSWYQPHSEKKGFLRLETLEINSEGIITLTIEDGFFVRIGENRRIVFPDLEVSKTQEIIDTPEELLYWQRLTYSFVEYVRRIKK